MIHFELLLENSPKHSTTEAISNQCCSWNNDPNENPVFKSFLISIVGRDTRQKTFQQILTKCNESTTEWKHILLLLRIVIEPKEYELNEHNKMKALAKGFIQDTFKKSIEEEDENGFHILFLIARQITKYNESLLGNYSNWYEFTFSFFNVSSFLRFISLLIDRFKNTIGEMKYVLKNAEFNTALTMLAGMVHLETNVDYLDVHINTYIPAPPRCNQLVLNYKELCKSRQAHLQCPSTKAISHYSPPVVIVNDDIFLIDDD